jgi:hypothetical protein
VVAGEEAAHEVIARPVSLSASSLFGVMTVRWHEDLDATSSEILDLFARPVAGVSETHAKSISPTTSNTHHANPPPDPSQSSKLGGINNT